jgi:mono/diheme cytochrome c family protein
MDNTPAGRGAMKNHARVTKLVVVAAMLMGGRNNSPASTATLHAGPNIRTNATNSSVSPIKGESWLTHLNRPFGDTSMGKTGILGPPPSGAEKEVTTGQAALLIGCTTQSTILRGADLYRLNCRGCHGEAGLGAPPEINSIIDPMRATSVRLVQERMKKVGASVSAAQATQLAQQAQEALIQRLQNGGKSMPPFSQLNEAEVRSILAYLRQLAGFPGAENEQIVVSESPVRVGELIAKSTCHICHSAAGPNPSPEQLLNGSIPPLETLTTRKNQSGLVEKVTKGASVLMGKPPMLFRGRMPVFHYLTPDEAADVYLYLAAYPPSGFSIVEPVATSSYPNRAPTGIDRPGVALGTRAGLNSASSGNWHRDSPAETEPVALILGMALLAAVLVAGGLTFTFWEFKRLSSKHEHRSSAARDARMNPTVARILVAEQGSFRSLSGGSKRRRQEQLSTPEGGGLTRKNSRGGRQCRGARLG